MDQEKQERNRSKLNKSTAVSIEYIRNSRFAVLIRFGMVLLSLYQFVTENLPRRNRWGWIYILRTRWHEIWNIHPFCTRINLINSLLLNILPIYHTERLLLLLQVLNTSKKLRIFYSKNYMIKDKFLLHHNFPYNYYYILQNFLYIVVVNLHRGDIQSFKKLYFKNFW